MIKEEVVAARISAVTIRKRLTKKKNYSSLATVKISIMNVRLVFTNTESETGLPCSNSNPIRCAEFSTNALGDGMNPFLHPAPALG